MEIVQKSKLGSTGVQVPVIGLGTWEMELSNSIAVKKVVDRARELGMTHIDTAEMYGSGKVEEIVGSAIGDHRNNFFLVSKVLPSNATFEGTLKACERSLSRLRTDYLDLYLLHWPQGPHFEETFRAFEKLQKEGKIRFFGVSNFNLNEMKLAEKIVGPGKIACNQVYYHLGERRIEHDLFSWCKEHDVAIVGYSPFDQGKFERRIAKNQSVLEKIAKRHGGTLRQVTLSFLTREPFLFTIPKASKIPHLEENAGASQIKLSAEEILELDRAFPVGSKVSGVAMI